MEGPGECCIVHQSGVDTTYAAVAATKIDRIMLRFRPIAPKPSPPPTSAAAASISSVSRPKRRPSAATSETPIRRGRRRRSSPSEQTLPILKPTQPPPSSPDTPLDPRVPHLPIWISTPAVVAERAEVVAPTPVRPIGSWVTVESVSAAADACDGICGACDGICGACDAVAAKRVLEGDACPCFVSDRADRVTWTNEAYREMVGGGGGEMRVALMTEGRVKVAAVGGFTCRVRVRYAAAAATATVGKERVSSVTAPCDVERLREGGLAWRLDVKAALCLGR
ncbi:hypothetical protein QJS04_geneDACA014088 [Acorus gramineus]|uniref:DUF7950 domain-containing protein n=1 Tax=Acorus gramineus TaxID=55184 RepID=A0AAV9B3W8_ACOGR|nr:hypothetical protein QJS04_geneDACA014088 [Acorus gramineus]